MTEHPKDAEAERQPEDLEVESDEGQDVKGGQGYLNPEAHQIISPRDAASGLPTGKRSHKP